MKYQGIELTPVTFFYGSPFDAIIGIRLSYRVEDDDYDPEQPTEPNINMPKFTWTVEVNDWNTEDADVSGDHRLAGAPS